MNQHPLRSDLYIGTQSADTHAPISALTDLLGLTASELLARAQSDLRLGLPVVLLDGAERFLAVFVEPLSVARFDALSSFGRVTLVLSPRRAQTLCRAEEQDETAVEIGLPAGVSLKWARAMSGIDMAGKVQAAHSLGQQVKTAPKVARAALLLAKHAQIMPAALIVPFGDHDLRPGMLELPAQTVIEHLPQLGVQTKVSAAHLPMDVSNNGRVHVFRADDGRTEHYAIEVGTPDLSQPVTVRLHSACFTGDVLGSLKCDCGPQLRAAMATMAAEGGGILLYLNQEGRGIGLANKMRAYALQETGLDTVEANHWLGFEDDQRDFGVGARLLHQIGVQRVCLMTNNPAKVAMLSRHGIEVVERRPLVVGRNTVNATYLATKAQKSGHLL